MTRRQLTDWNGIVSSMLGEPAKDSSGKGK